jgi:hypothetical protein
MKSFSKEIRVLPCLSYASGSSDRVSKVIDTKGFDSVAIVVHHAAVHDSAVLDVFLQEADAASDADTLTSGANLAGTSQTIAGTADNTVTVIEVNKPLRRFLQLNVNNDATNATAQSAIAYLFNADACPTTHAEGTGTSGGSATVAVEQFLSPIAGTK